MCVHKIYIFICRFICNCLQHLSHKNHGGKRNETNHIWRRNWNDFLNSWVEKQRVSASERTHAGSCELLIQQRIVPAEGLYWAHLYVNLWVSPSLQAVLQNIPSQIASPQTVKLLYKFIIQKRLGRGRCSPWFCTSKACLVASAQEITSLPFFWVFFSILFEIHQNA